MTDYNAAAEAARGLAKQFRALLTVGEALGELGSLQNIRAELEEAKKKAEADLIPAKARLEEANTELAAVLNQIEKASLEAQVELKAHTQAMAEGSRQSAEVTNSALEVAKRKLDELLVEYEREKDLYSTQIKELEREKTEIERSVAELRGELEALRNRLVLPALDTR